METRAGCQGLNDLHLFVCCSYKNVMMRNICLLLDTSMEIL